MGNSIGDGFPQGLLRILRDISAKRWLDQHRFPHGPQERSFDPSIVLFPFFLRDVNRAFSIRPYAHEIIRIESQETLNFRFFCCFHYEGIVNNTA